MAAEVCYDAPQGLPDATMMLVAVQHLATIPEAKDREEAFLTLLKLVDGVLGAPEDPKKRRLKKGNATFQQKVGRFAAGIDFLKAAGFVDSDDPEAEGEEGRDALLSMPVADLLRLTDAHHTLARAALEVGITPPPMPGGGFNPYVANMQAADTTRTVKAGESWKTDAEKIREEVKRREQELKAKLEEAPPIDMQPSAFWLSSGRRLEDIIRETQSVEDRSAEDKSADNALMQSQLAQSKAAINGSNTKFESADKRRLAELSHKRVHAFCILRIICPDKSVLQVHFRAKERGDKVLEMISPLLAPNVRELGWYIYQSPPMMKLGPKETLAAAGFTPGASLYLGFEGGARPPAPYLEASLVSQLGPPPAEAGRGVNAPAGPTFSGEAMGWGTGQKLGAPAPAALAASAPAAGADGGPVPMEQ